MSKEARATVPFLIFECVQDGAPYAGDLFKRKFGDPIPNHPNHYIAIYRSGINTLHVASYGHVTLHQGIGLGGGSCSDERILRLMSPVERQALRAAGGLHCLLIQYIFERFAEQAAMIFAYCGDNRAELVDLRAGFEKTDRTFLLRKILRPISDAEVETLTERAAAIGPF